MTTRCTSYVAQRLRCYGENRVLGTQRLYFRYTRDLLHLELQRCDHYVCSYLVLVT